MEEAEVREARLKWCPVHGDVTACPCRPVPKKYLPAIQRNWWQATHKAVVIVLSRHGVRVRHDKL